MEKYKWVFYDWLNCSSYIFGTRKEAKAQFKKMKKEHPSMDYHCLQKVRLLTEAESQSSDQILIVK